MVVAVRRRLAAVAAVAGLAVLAGCGSSSHPSTTTGGATSAGSSTTQTATGSSTGAGSTGSSTTSTTSAQNLHVTTALRAQLVQAGAASHSLTAADYTGLVPGRTYYTYDPATSTYWAGAALVPSSSSMPAQVSSQDDGSYLLFTRPANGAWTVYSVGMTGIAGAKCPVPVPASVLAVWAWAPGTCRPAS